MVLYKGIISVFLAFILYEEVVFGCRSFVSQKDESIPGEITFVSNETLELCFKILHDGMMKVGRIQVYDENNQTIQNEDGSDTFYDMMYADIQVEFLDEKEVINAMKNEIQTKQRITIEGLEILADTHCPLGYDKHCNTVIKECARKNTLDAKNTKSNDELHSIMKINEVN